jgi:hypothetical protein
MSIEGNMDHSKPFISFATKWWDEDLLELTISGSNGAYSGTADVCLGHDHIKEMRKVFEGFPKTATDTRHFELGTFDDKFAGGGVRFCLLQADSLGHCKLRLAFRRDPRFEVETADFFLMLTPSDIDRMLLKLDRSFLVQSQIVTIEFPA